MVQEGPRILARTLFQQMLGNGYSVSQIITVSSELIGLLTSQLRELKHATPVRDTADIALQSPVTDK